MCKQGLCPFHASQYPSVLKLAGGAALLVMVIPQLATQPFDPGVAVPGAPVSAGLGTQKSLVMPHWPQTLQQTLSGQGLRSASIDMLAG
jgi:hypothetical protein